MEMDRHDSLSEGLLNGDEAGPEVVRPTPSFFARHKKAIAATGVVCLLAAIAIVGAVAGTRGLAPSSSGSASTSSRPADAPQDPALAAMPPARVMPGSQPGFVRYVTTAPYTGAADGHSSAIFYDVEVNEKIVSLDTVMAATSIKCHTPFSDGMTPTTATQVNGTTIVNTTSINAEANGTLVVFFATAASAQAYAASWPANHTILALASTWGCGNAYRRVHAALGFVGATGVAFDTSAAPLSDCFRNGHFSYNVTNTESSSAGHRRRRDLSGTFSTSVSKTYTIVSQDDLQSGSYSGSVSGSASTTISVGISFQASMGFDWAGLPNSLAAAVQTQGEIDLNIGVQASASYSNSFGPKSTDYYEVFAVVIPIGPVPMPVSIQVAGFTGADLQLSGQASLTETITVTGGASASVTWDPDAGVQFNMNRAAPQLNSGSPQLSASASASLQVYAGPSVFLKLYGVGGPVFDVPVTGEIVASVGQDNSCTDGVALGCNAWITAKVSAMFSALGFSKSTDKYKMFESPHVNIYQTCLGG